MSRRSNNEGGSRYGGNGPGPLPQRWLHCPRKACSIIADKFLAFKTPLDSRFDNAISSITDEGFFHPEMIFQSLKSQKKKLGLWVDLTNTSRFYDKNIVENANCKYVKLNCKGHGETPGPDTVELFIKICSSFIRQNPLEVIGVHCTHGFNRTGFLIVSYLVRELDWSVEAAVAEFAKVRPPGIYKGDYLLELFRLYGDVEDTPPPPVLPQWHSECDDTDHPTAEEPEAEEEASTSNGEPQRKKRRKETIQIKATFMEGIPNVKPVMDMDLVKKVQQRIQQLCGFKSSGFPGCQPVSMDQKNLHLLEKPYMVSWKADGTRYMMYIMGQYQCFFIDRDNAVFQIDGLTFVSGHNRSRHLVDTLLDGEMVIDKDESGQKYPRYLIYDFVSLEGNSIRQEDFNVRYRTIVKEIIDPRVAAMKEGRIYRDREPIGVRRKEFWPINTTEYLLSDRFKAKLSHEPDGLIFQPVEEPYTAGTCPSVLKWKPPSHNSVDFRLKVVVQQRPGMLRERIGQLFVGGMDEPMAFMKVTKSLVPYDGKIIECRYDFDTKEWTFMRERTDKSFPNSYKTAMAVWESIREPVTEFILVDFISRNSPSAASIMAPPPPPSGHRRPHY